MDSQAMGGAVVAQQIKSEQHACALVAFQHAGRCAFSNAMCEPESFPSDAMEAWNAKYDAIPMERCRRMSDIEYLQLMVAFLAGWTSARVGVQGIPSPALEQTSSASSERVP